MKKRIAVFLIALVLCFFASSITEVRAESSDKILGTWVSRKCAVDGKEYVMAAIYSITFYENGSYNGTSLTLSPMNGYWSMEDNIITTDDATMVLEDDDTLIVYMDKYQITCRRGDSSEGRPALEPAEASQTAISLMTDCFNVIDNLFQNGCEAMNATLQYIEDGKYSSLLYARMKCTEVMKLTREATVPVNLFESLDDNALKLMGIDADHTYMLPIICEGAINDVQNSITLLSDYVFGGYWSKEMKDIVSSFAENRIKYYQAIGKMQPVSARLVFLGILEEEGMETFWQSVPERWGIIGADLHMLSDQDELLEYYLELQDQAREASEITQDMYEQFYNWFYEIEKDISEGKGKINTMDYMMPDGMPQIIVPVPNEWLHTEQSMLSTKSNSSGKDVQDEIILTVQPMESAEFIWYMNILLPSISSQEYLIGNNEDGWSCHIQENGIDFRCEWKPDNVARIYYDPSNITIERDIIGQILSALQ